MAPPTPPPCCGGPASTIDAVAARLGADVAFCVVGGRARVTGIGEVLDPLPFVARTLTLLTPPFGCSTPAVYRAWDDLGGPAGDGPNDLEPAALAVEPRLADWRDRLGDATGQAPVLAGSGSTWFVEGALPRQRPGRPGCVHTTPPRLRRRYLPARRCQRVRFSIFLCFFLRIRLRRFLISDPMAGDDASGWSRPAQKDVRSGQHPTGGPG